MIIEAARIAGRPGVFSIEVEDGKISGVNSVDREANQLIVPALTDIHVHLDKTHLIDRCPEPVQSLGDAIAVCAKAMAASTPKDIHDRAVRALRQAFEHGVFAMRSHVNWYSGETPVAWSLLNELAQQWQGRMALQLASLTPLDAFVEIGPQVAKSVASDRGVLGAFVLLNDDQENKIKMVFDLAEKYDLPLDFHVDETLDPEAQGLDMIIAETEKRQMSGRVLCGHCCSLAHRPPEVINDLLARAAAAGVGLVALPSTNSYLQDRSQDFTPRLRGLAPIKEARSHGVDTMLGNDNCQDPFYPYGNYDLVDIYRMGVLGAHLDPEDWIESVTRLPRKWMDLSSAEIAPGHSADFILFDGRTFSDLISQPRLGRKVYHNGNLIMPGGDLGKRVIGQHA